MERIGGLAVAGDLNIPCLSSLAILQVRARSIITVLFHGFRSKDACKMLSPEKLTTCNRISMFALKQGIAERACLVGEVLSRATPAYSGCEKFKSEPLCSSSIIPQVRWRPSSLDKMLEVSDSFWL